MKVIAYMPLHYGKEYLEASIKSIDKFVDHIVILYTPEPSYGFASKEPCPETQAELLEIANKASDKIKWITKGFGNEGEHRKFIQNYTGGYDLTLAIDADEVWDEPSLERCLQQAHESDCRHIGITGFVNFWKSFDLACYDGFAPIRITNNNNPDGTENFRGKVYHMSCFQDWRIMKYKWQIHGHKDELRKDWWTKYERGDTEDIHPVAIGLWNAVPFDKTTLPEILKQHPNYEVCGPNS